MKGRVFAASFKDPKAPSKPGLQYFEIFGHRGLWHRGWKAVAYHPIGTRYEDDNWELFNLDQDFSETNDLAEQYPEKLQSLVKVRWEQAEQHKILPLDDRFAPRIIENATRFHG